MIHNHAIAAVDRTLRQLRAVDSFVGNAVFVFCGDFRQTAPIVTNARGLRATEADAVAASISQLPAWRDVRVMPLAGNHRQNGDAPFAAFLRTVGDGTAPHHVFDPAADAPPAAEHVIRLPRTITAVDDQLGLIRHVYGANINDRSAAELSSRAILSPTNASCDSINNALLEALTGPVHTLPAADRIADIDELNARHLPLPNGPPPAWATPEQLNAVNESGAPKGVLRLKVGAVVMFMRNVSLTQGMANGQKGLIHAITLRMLTVLLLRPGARTFVQVPRIDITVTPRNGRLTFIRRQFPITLAYAMTVHKSQGQTLSRFGIDLRQQCFSHGMAYVALSRARRAQDVAVLVTPAYRVDVNHQDVHSAACIVNIVSLNLLRA
jgi:hypothetical protein